MNFSVIIPTYKRQSDLETILGSIREQDRLPDEVVIIDDDRLPSAFLEQQEVQLKQAGVDSTYHRKDHDTHPQGSSTSRNLGLELVGHEICFILDDDLILDTDFFAQIMQVWEEHQGENLIGVGGVIKNNRRRGRLERLYSRLFGLSSDLSWDVNEIGFQDWNDWIEKREKGYYVHGGVCSYKKSIVQELGGFTVLSGGRDALEDVDFCLRAKQVGYHFMIEPEAKVIHNHSPSGREGSLAAGFKEGYNRRRIFSDHCQQTIKHRIWFGWANSGWILRQLLVGRLSRAAGMLKGLLSF